MGKDDVKVQDGVQQVDSVENSIPTDEELAAAFDAAELDLEQPATTEQGVTETVSVEAEPTSDLGSEDEDGEGDDDPEDQKDRSRLGRRLKRLEGNLETMLKRMEADEQRRQIREYHEAQQRNARPANDQDEPNPDSDIVTTETDVERVMDKRERRKVEVAERYQNAFVSQLRDLGSANPKMHKAIIDELITNFNRKVTGDPAIDARLNYAEAKAAVATKIAAAKISEKPKPNIAGGTPVATGVSASATAQKGGKSDIWSKLDPEAAAYAKAVKMSDEEIEAALAGETPLNLKPGRQRMG